MPIRSTTISRTLEQLRERLHTALNRWRPGQRGDSEVKGEARPLARTAYRGPALDVEETDDTVIVRAELPGLRPADFTIETTADRLTIRGEKRVESEERGRGFYRVERRYGAFARSVALPCAIDRDRAEATYADGVLRVTLPKTEAAKARQIKIAVT